MLYKKNTSPSLDDGLFKNPTSEYRSTPFWSWNYSLEKDELLRQIDIFKEMGFGGFHMHVRTGLSTSYLSDGFMTLVKNCVEKAKENKMLAWLYDEDRWPSGFAGGLVTKDERFRERYIQFSPEKKENSKLLACYDICLDNDGYLKSYKKIGENEEAENDKWYVYLEIITDSLTWFNNQCYVDTLNPEAIKKFVEITHERYKEVIGDEFDETVPAIFTDEPNFTKKQSIDNSFDKKAVELPWTDRLTETYREQYNEDIFATLPEIIWELPDGKASVARYRYHDHTAELFAKSFSDTVGNWCAENKIALTGHVLDEPTLTSQSRVVGDAMRSYRSFGIPGIDMLCNAHEYTTAKQASSAVHQLGKEGMLSELYGVTGWNFDFRGYKLHGDWQACMGVTVRVPHLSWYAMEGEAKRDYPASISYQSPWYKEYPLLEDHFARINTAMTRGKPVVKVGVIHPIESYWLHFGANDKTLLVRESMDRRFVDIVSWLIESSIDFDFINEAMLPDLCKKGGSPLCVGEMKYDAVIVPYCETLRSTTLERLENFRKDGGKLIFLGEAPSLENAEISERGKKLCDASILLPFDAGSLVSALDDVRTLTMRYENGKLADKHIYSLRQDKNCKWLFICRGKDPVNKDLTELDKLTVTINEICYPVLYDTLSGDIKPYPCTHKNGKTVISLDMYSHDSVLLRLDESGAEVSEIKKSEYKGNVITIPNEVDFKLEEPNVLLLDIAEFKLDDDEYLPEEEILKADNIAREIAGINLRGGSVAQPWTLPEETPRHTISLRYTVESEIDCEGAQLALETPEKAEIIFNGEKISNKPVGNYVDISIFKVDLPKINKGKNILEITLPLGNRTNTEACYILGSFGVKLKGKKAVITEMPEKIPFGNLVSCGMPFYGGNTEYKFKVKPENGSVKLTVSDYRGGLIRVYVDGEDKGTIIYAPYELTVDGLTNDDHEITLKLYGHRYNTFGAVHIVNKNERWHGPGAWRTIGENWSYEYNPVDLGILKSPEIEI
ncbi:MAG: hypothetical protein PUJ59_05280 [Clostridiaceae bacterium]|nr:hypothetical protein [Clostridiaceae bacterium]MDY5888916.1 hypothetical protein [Oscillospiraceae bacterium]